MDARYDVVVIGGGPVGLAVACGVARSSRRVLVLEKDDGTSEHSRAPAIWSRSQEILARLGALGTCVERGFTIDTLDLRDADGDDSVLLTIPLHELMGVTSYPRLLILPQSETERILYEAVRAQPTGRVAFGAEATAIDQDVDGASITYRQGGATEVVRAAFVAGCDGASSMVRESIGASFEGETYDMRAALADIRPHEAQKLAFPRVSTRFGLAVGIRMSELMWRLILPFGNDDDRDLDDRVERAAGRLFPGVHTRADYRTVWQSEFRLHRRVASRFVRDRVALAGDAAHLNSPVGGQGMNAGFADAAMLIDALLRALDHDDPAPLRKYESLRNAEVKEGVNVFTDRMTRALLLGRGRALRPVLAAGRLALRVPPLRRRFLRRLAMLDATVELPS